MADSTLYLFDGYNLLHAGPFADARELGDALASFVAERGARGVLVFDGVGTDLRRGPLEIRFADHADTLLERLAAAAGIEVQKLSSRTFFRDLPAPALPDAPPGGLAGKLDEETRARLERLRRGE